MPPSPSAQVQPLRVAVWTTGNVIRQAVRAIDRRDDLELVGAYAHSPEKVGQDVGRLCRMDRNLGVVATDDVDALLSLDLDAVVYSPLHIDPAEVSRLLQAGVNVVTTAELVTGRNLSDADRELVDAAARAGGATLFGSGMNPGYAQLLAAVSAGISSGVDHVRVSESVDVSQFVGDSNFEAMGWGRAGGDPGHAADVEAGSIVFAEAVELLGELLGVKLDDIRCDVTFAHATEDIALPSMTIPTGHVAGMDVVWSGHVGDGPSSREVVAVAQRWLASTHIEPPWTVEHGYLVEVSGDPNLRLRLEIWPTEADMADLTVDTMHSIGMRITAVPVVNAIPAVVAAPPGIATYADLPVVTSPLVTTVEPAT